MRANIDVFGFDLDAEDLSVLDHLTVPQSLEDFRVLYEKCVARDTPNEAARVGVKLKVTLD